MSAKSSHFRLYLFLGSEFTGCLEVPLAKRRDTTPWFPSIFLSNTMHLSSVLSAIISSIDSHHLPKLLLALLPISEDEDSAAAAEARLRISWTTAANASGCIPPSSKSIKADSALRSNPVSSISDNSHKMSSTSSTCDDVLEEVVREAVVICGTVVEIETA